MHQEARTGFQSQKKQTSFFSTFPNCRKVGKLVWRKHACVIRDSWMHSSDSWPCLIQQLGSHALSGKTSRSLDSFHTAHRFSCTSWRKLFLSSSSHTFPGLSACFSFFLFSLSLCLLSPSISGNSLHFNCLTVFFLPLCHSRRRCRGFFPPFWGINNIPLDWFPGAQPHYGL